MTIDIEGLREFIEARDRSDPPYFAGRKEVIADIETICRTMWQRHTAGAPQHKGMTRIIHGAPGAGKTSVLGHLACRRNDGEPRIVNMPGPDSLESGDELAALLAGALKAGLDKTVLQQYNRHMQLQLGIGGTHVQHGREVSDPRQPDPVRSVLAHHPVKKWQYPVVLAIDEFQNTAGDRFSPHARILQAVHNQKYQAPIMLVLAGLGDTVDRAMELGLSRPAQGTTWTLGCFDEAESDDLIAGWGRHFGLPDGDWRNTMRGIAEDCDHWPVHVQNALMALAEEVVAADGRLEDVQSSVVRARSRKRQLAYYRQRMSPQMEGSRFLLSAVMQDLQESHDRGDIIDSIEWHADSRPGSRWRLPDGMTVNEYFNHLIHRGALHKHLDTGTVECPIPSFRAWLTNQGAPLPEPEPYSSPSPF